MLYQDSWFYLGIGNPKEVEIFFCSINYLNVQFYKINWEFSSSIEGEDWVLFDFSHSGIRGQQHVHSIASVSYHHQLGPFVSAFGFFTFIVPTYSQNPNFNTQNPKTRIKIFLENQNNNAPIERNSNVNIWLKFWPCVIHGEQKRGNVAFSWTWRSLGAKQSWRALKAIWDFVFGKNVNFKLLNSRNELCYENKLGLLIAWVRG